MTYQEISDKAYAADDAWQAELEKEYGKDAGDARYDERGYATAELAALKAGFLEASAALRRMY